MSGGASEEQARRPSETGITTSDGPPVSGATSCVVRIARLHALAAVVPLAR
jgi:hypothetical protein